RPIPKEASAIHGITDEDVANEPTFKELSEKVQKLIDGCDLGGYNSDRFDVPLLAEELLRADREFNFKNISAVAVQTIFNKKEKRTLEAAYQFYCAKDLTAAHSAEADTKATFEVLEAQLDRYPDLKNDMKWLAEYSSHRRTADFAGFIRYDKEGYEVFGFGKHKGKRVEQILEKEPGYFGWMQNAQFPRYTKKVLTEIKLRKLSEKLN